MTDDNGLLRAEIKGKKAHGVLERYILWAGRDFVGAQVLPSQSDFDRYKENIKGWNEYRDELKALKNRRLRFYIM